MAVNTGVYSNNEIIIYNYLRLEVGLTIAAACGILANIERESNFNHNAEGDNKTSYGLFQWHDTRYQELVNFCSKYSMNYRSVEGQLAFFRNEWMTTESAARIAISRVNDDADGAYGAAYFFCTMYERPSDSNSKGEERGAIARDKYYSYYSKGSNDLDSTGHSTVTTGRTIVEIARKQVDKPVRVGEIGPDAFDDAGLVYYCYNEAGFSIPDMTADDYYAKYSENSIDVSIDGIAPGDLVFYDNIGVGIATGDGDVIAAWYPPAVSVEYIGEPDHVVRILPKTTTSITPGGSSPEYDNSPSYSDIINNDPYSSVVTENIHRVESEGFDLGYLIDMTHGGEFKFYVPEFEESAGASWDSVNIIGRSVNIVSYSHTNSRVVDISLDLYAGVGLYVGNNLEDSVSMLHRDANFLKSLEYPDYTNPITRPPSTVHLILGSSVNILGIVSDVTVRHMKPIDSQNRSMYLKVGFKVTQIANNPPDWTDIKNNQYARATTATRY